MTTDCSPRRNIDDAHVRCRQLHNTQ